MDRNWSIGIEQKSSHIWVRGARSSILREHAVQALVLRSITLDELMFNRLHCKSYASQQ